MRDGGLLLELESLGLELGGLLQSWSTSESLSHLSPWLASLAYLGNLEQGLGDVNDTAEVLDALDALLHGLGVVGAGAVQDARDLLDLLLGVVGPGRAGVLADSPEDGEQREGDDGLLVDDVELVADGGDRDTGTGGEDGGLAQEVAAGEGVDDALGLLLGCGLVALQARLDGGHGGLVQGGDGGGGTRAGGACWGESTG